MLISTLFLDDKNRLTSQPTCLPVTARSSLLQPLPWHMLWLWEQCQGSPLPFALHVHLETDVEQIHQVK